MECNQSMNDSVVYIGTEIVERPNVDAKPLVDQEMAQDQGLYLRL